MIKMDLEMDSNNTETSSVDDHDDTFFASAIIVSSVLSLVGSGAIILTYIVFRELRTTMRCLLVHLSLANFISSLTNLIGAVYHLIRPDYYPITDSNGTDGQCSLCQAQSIISLYGFEASVLWTIVFIVYMYLLIACCRPTPLTNTVVLGIVSLATWIVPIPIVTAFVVMKVEQKKCGNCYSPPFYASYRSFTGDMETMEIIGYKVFLYLSFIVLLILTVIFIVHLCYLKRHHNLFGYDMSHYSRVIRTAELKLVLVPIFYLALKIFPLTVDILNLFHTHDEKLLFVILMIAFIGDSGQGFLNGVLFILFTKSARDRVFSHCFACCCRCCVRGNSLESESISDHNTPSTFSYRTRKTNSVSVNTAVGDSDYIIKQSPVSFNADFTYGATNTD